MLVDGQLLIYVADAISPSIRYLLTGINVDFSRQCSNVLLFGITRLRLSLELIKNRLYMGNRWKKPFYQTMQEKESVNHLETIRAVTTLSFFLSLTVLDTYLSVLYLTLYSTWLILSLICKRERKDVIRFLNLLLTW